MGGCRKQKKAKVPSESVAMLVLGLDLYANRRF